VEAFYQQEIAARKALHYPPFSRIVQLKISGTGHRETEAAAGLAGKHCRQIQAAIPSVTVLGPVEAPLSKIANRYRRQIFLKSPGSKIIHQFLNRYFTLAKGDRYPKGIRIVADIDPFMML
jgi:primosomal protein N' (replication factor Y)